MPAKVITVTTSPRWLCPLFVPPSATTNRAEPPAHIQKGNGTLQECHSTLFLCHTYMSKTNKRRTGCGPTELAVHIGVGETVAQWWQGGIEVVAGQNWLFTLVWARWWHGGDEVGGG